MKVYIYITISQSGWLWAVPLNSMNVANPSFSQRSSHHFIVTKNSKKEYTNSKKNISLKSNYKMTKLSSKWNPKIFIIAPFLNSRVKERQLCSLQLFTPTLSKMAACQSKRTGQFYIESETSSLCYNYYFINTLEMIYHPIGVCTFFSYNPDFLGNLWNYLINQKLSPLAI